MLHALVALHEAVGHIRQWSYNKQIKYTIHVSQDYSANKTNSKNH